VHQFNTKLKKKSFSKIVKKMVRLEDKNQNLEKYITSDEIQKSTIILRGLNVRKDLAKISKFLYGKIDDYKSSIRKKVNTEGTEGAGEAVVYIPANFSKVQPYMEIIRDCDKQIMLLQTQD
tara:strand:- start:47 stop:409 length:363 start_codon:yes stop_codon:yes gene_type:complete